MGDLLCWNIDLHCWNIHHPIKWRNVPTLKTNILMSKYIIPFLSSYQHFPLSPSAFVLSCFQHTTWICGCATWFYFPSLMPFYMLPAWSRVLCEWAPITSSRTFLMEHQHWDTLLIEAQGGPLLYSFRDLVKTWLLDGSGNCNKSGDVQLWFSVFLLLLSSHIYLFSHLQLNTLKLCIQILYLFLKVLKFWSIFSLLLWALYGYGIACMCKSLICVAWWKSNLGNM